MKKLSPGATLYEHQWQFIVKQGLNYYFVKEEKDADEEEKTVHHAISVLKYHKPIVYILRMMQYDEIDVKKLTQLEIFDTQHLTRYYVDKIVKSINTLNPNNNNNTTKRKS